ncbi:MAG: T9SS type A sorting domain-containing protein [Bacteroidetes bacterium]|nr:T9SS type A sorting domain-containing protein [Bacteroidota bacterium]
MKKQLLSVFAALTVTASVFAQTPSPSWATSQQAAFPNPTLGIKFLDAVDQNVVWVISGDYAVSGGQYPTQYYSRTTNGGNTFVSGVIPGVGGNPWEVANLEAVDANTAWIACYNQISGGNGAIFKTSNGGTTWVNMTAAGMYTNNTQSFLNLVTFLTPSIGLTVGDPINMGGQDEYEIWRTVDGGNTWALVPGANIPNPLMTGEYNIVDLFAKHGNSNIWFGTNAGRIYRSNDAGLTWAVSAVAASNTTLTEIAFSSALDGVCYVWNGTTYEMYNTTNGGVTWSLINPTPANTGLSEIVAVPGTNYYVSAGFNSNTTNSNDMISYSNNNGSSWTDWGTTGITYVKVDMASASAGWVGTNSNGLLGFSNLYKFSSSLAPSTTPPSSAFYLPPTLCSNNPSATVVNNSTGTAPLSYTWSASPVGVVFSSTSALAPSVTFPSVGSYTVSLTVAGSGSTSVSSQVVNVISCNAPTVSFSLATSACNNATFAVNSTVQANPAAGLAWSISPSNNTTITPSPAVANPEIKVLNPGTYTLSLIATNIFGTTTETQAIVVNDCAPSPNFTLEPVVCRTATVFAWNQTQNVPGATNNTYLWTWSPSSNPNQPIAFTATQSPAHPIPNGSRRIIFNASTNANITATQVYTVTLRAANGSGTASISQTIAVVPRTPIPVILPNTPLISVCALTTTLGVSPGGADSYIWSDGSTTSVIDIPVPNVSSSNVTYSISGTNFCGTNTVSRTYVIENTCVGISENTLSERLSVYPNPAHEQFTVYLPNANSIYTIKMINVLGSVVYEESVKNTSSLNINVANNAKGVYFLSVEANGEKATKKIIVE